MIDRCVAAVPDSLYDLICDNTILLCVYGDSPALLLLRYSETGIGVRSFRR